MYHVDIVHTKDFQFSAKSAHAEFPIDMKGAGGMTPPDVLLASLGSCVGVYIRKYAEGSRLPIENFSVNIDAELSKESPVAFRSITVKVDLKGVELEERRRHALIEFVRNCPVHNTLHGNPEVHITL